MKKGKLKHILFIVTTYLTWAVLAAASFFLIFSGRAAILAALARYSSTGFEQRMMAGTLDKVYMIVAGITILGFTIGIERYLSNTRTWKALAGRALLCLGIEGMALFVSTLILQVASRVVMASFEFAVFLLLPLLAAAGAFAGSVLLRRASKKDQSFHTSL